VSRFTPVHEAWWAAANKAHGDAADTRALIDALAEDRVAANVNMVGRRDSGPGLV
jgi:hypothetical protein